MQLTANVSDTCSNCFDTVATAFAILCFVTNITSDNDQPCKITKKGERGRERGREGINLTIIHKDVLIESRHQIEQYLSPQHFSGS